MKRMSNTVTNTVAQNATNDNTAQIALDIFVDRYIQMWNEPDAVARRACIEALWSPDASNATATMIAVGHDEIEARVTRSFDLFVGTGVHHFRHHQPYVAHHGAMRVWWEMVTVADGAVAAIGQEFLVLDSDGRIVSDHQFPVAL
jgi:hypothetical protein